MRVVLSIELGPEHNEYHIHQMQHLLCISVQALFNPTKVQWCLHEGQQPAVLTGGHR